MNDRDTQILDFEKRFYTTQSGKEAAIADEFGLSSIRYYQLLNRLLDDPAALAADPVLVKRLRRIRSTRLQARRRAG